MNETMTAGLTPDDRKQLRAPFASSAIRWLPIAGVIYDKQQFMPHVNASLVFERLSDVDPSWTVSVEPEIANTATDSSDPFGVKHGAPHRALLTVKGVTRPGRGQVEPGAKQDDKLLKSVESDAIKRAALAFEVGAYLRAFETVFLPRLVGGKETFKTKKGKDRYGKEVDKFTYLTEFGKVQLRAHYDRIMATTAFRDRYGEPVEYGDVAAFEIEGSLADEEAMTASESAAAEPQAKGQELATLLLLSKYDGRDTPEDVVREALADYPFTKLLPRKLNSVKASLLIDPEDAEKLRSAAITAAGGGDDELLALTDALDELAALAEAKGSEDANQEALNV